MTKVNKQTEVSETLDKLEELKEKMSANTGKSTKQLSSEEVKLRQEKPFFGGAVGSGYLSPSTGAIKKAKHTLMVEKKKTEKKALSRVIEKNQKCTSIDEGKEAVAPIESRSSTASKIIVTYDSLYNTENQGETPTSNNQIEISS